MVLPLLLGVAALGLTGFWTLQATATLAHWIAVGGAGATAIALFYQTVTEGYLKELFDSEAVEYVSIGTVSAVIGFFVFRFLEAVLATVGAAASLLIVVLIIASAVLGPALVFGTLADLLLFLVGLVDELVGGD